MKETTTSIPFSITSISSSAPPIRLKKIRETILLLAVHGKLVAQDPADEPAPILLERIKREQQRLIKEGKIKKSRPLSPITGQKRIFEKVDQLMRLVDGMQTNLVAGGGELQEELLEAVGGEWTKCWRN